MNIQNILGKTCVVLGIATLLAIPAMAWLSTPIEVFDRSTGNCLYQLETDWLGQASQQVPCGTHGELAVERVSELFM